MPAIIEERTIAAAPGRVFNALTQQDGIACWWTSDLSARPEVGSLAEFRFRQGAAGFQFEIAELNQDEKVHWILRQGPPQWAGTSITWKLTPAQNGTRLVFTHEGLPQDQELYVSGVRGNWKYYLDSLKSYLETGKGTPGDPPNV